MHTDFHKELSTEELILEAARTIFIKKGFEGSRMQEIADLAGINKALLHYYFRSKDKLFEAVFEKIAINLFPAMKQIIEADLYLVEKLVFFIQMYTKMLSENPFIPAFVLNTINTSPERFTKHLSQTGFNPMALQNQIDKEAALQKIRPIKVEHLMVNLISMCVFPYVAKPIIKHLFQFDDKAFAGYLEERKTEIVDFVINSISLS